MPHVGKKIIELKSNKHIFFKAAFLWLGYMEISRVQGVWQQDPLLSQIIFISSISSFPLMQSPTNFLHPLNSTLLHQQLKSLKQANKKKNQTFKTSEERLQWMFLVVIIPVQFILTTHWNMTHKFLIKLSQHSKHLRVIPYHDTEKSECIKTCRCILSLYILWLKESFSRWRKWQSETETNAQVNFYYTSNHGITFWHQDGK